MPSRQCQIAAPARHQDIDIANTHNLGLAFPWNTERDR